MAILEMRVGSLEQSHSESAVKINTLVESVNTLTLNLSVLIAKIDSGLRSMIFFAGVVVVIIGAFFSYQAYQDSRYVQINSEQHLQIEKNTASVAKQGINNTEQESRLDSIDSDIDEIHNKKVFNASKDVSPAHGR